MEEIQLIRRKYMRTRQLKPGMRIDHAVLDRMGRNLISRGAVLDEYQIESMLKLGVMAVYIQDGEYSEEEEKPPISPAIEKEIKQLRTDDSSKVTLSASVRKRVSEGIQFLYNDTKSEHFESTSTDIANDLLDCINSNDAIAIDINALKTSDEYTFKHSVDVATIAMVMAKQQKLPQNSIRDIGIAGLLHDVGKTKIPIEILNKPGRLEESEFQIMKQHSVYGYNILKEGGTFNEAILLGVLQHHEKINGKGYPMGVDKSKMATFAKILNVADIYDALVTERPYKAAFSQREAVEMIMSMTDELDLKCMYSFLESMILYPVDSIVDLSNGEKAAVVKNNPKYILRPTVVSLTSGKVYDLSGDIDCANIVII